MHVMFDQQNSDPQLVADAAEQCDCIGGLGRVHPRGWLVQQQQQRLRSHRPGNLDPPLPAVRQAGGKLVACATQANEFQPLYRLVVRIAFLFFKARAA